MFAVAPFVEDIARTLQLKPPQVEHTLQLLGEGATVPFIARYRKERTDSLDEVAIGAVRDLAEKLAEISKRRHAVLEALRERDQLDQGLQRQILEAQSLQEIEDLYLPFRPKRKTRAMLARERGLRPLAEMLLAGRSPLPLAGFLNPEQSVPDKESALAGARDIIAEEISENASTRSALRRLYRQAAVIETKVVAKNVALGDKYRDYFQWREPAAKAAGHRLLAVLRGAEEKILAVTMRPPEEQALALLHRLHPEGGVWRGEVFKAIDDGYRRLLAPAMENELSAELKAKADEEAIRVFVDNLRQLLLAPPLGERSVLAIDPGYRTGAKVACLDKQGKLLEHTTIFPTHGGRKLDEAREKLTDLINRHHIAAIAVGNGTAGRETLDFIGELELSKEIVATMVNEDGASIYSASECARREFLDLDLTVRGAVSIGRRLQDPLAELVKIDAKSIGVGQYQHDVHQGELKKALNQVVESCVNSVGVELNTASVELLTFVAGLGPALAAAIVAYRNDHGPFEERTELLRVPRLGPKAFEQCAGFLRIRNGKNPLDRGAVHPERYSLVRRMAKDLRLSVENLMTDERARQQLDLTAYVDDQVGMPTLLDIVAELAKPGRDPRQAFERFDFAAGLRTIDDLHQGMMVPAIITNVTKFGAFADIGIKENGLIHISQLADRYIKEPGEVVKVGDRVEVRVMDIDKGRHRIALSMRKNP
jgi:protein Tex